MLVGMRVDGRRMQCLVSEVQVELVSAFSGDLVGEDLITGNPAAEVA